ncbi:MAG TPA: hypothetical protein EYN06_07695, partial [Myxococcales bacterium]|nr:hypothetical protein [Myxococcales bacterium]
MVRFRRIPASWKLALATQIASERKKRFFKSIEPVEENGVLVGVRVHMGVGSFSTRLYTKTKPARWVLRVGDAIAPPAQRGP